MQHSPIAKPKFVHRNGFGTVLVAQWREVLAHLFDELHQAGLRHLRARRSPDGLPFVLSRALAELTTKRSEPYYLLKGERCRLLDRVAAALAKQSNAELDDLAGRKAPGVARAEREARRDLVRATVERFVQEGQDATLDAVHSVVKCNGFGFSRSTVARYLADDRRGAEREALGPDARRLLDLVEGALERGDARCVLSRGNVDRYLWDRDLPKDAFAACEEEHRRHYALVDAAAAVERVTPSVTLQVVSDGVAMVPRGEGLHAEHGAWVTRPRPAKRAKGAAPEETAPDAAAPEPAPAVAEKAGVPVPVVWAGATWERDRARTLGRFYGGVEASVVVAAMSMEDGVGLAQMMCLARAVAPDDMRYVGRVLRTALAKATENNPLARYLHRAVTYRADSLTKRAAAAIRLVALLAGEREYLPIASDDPAAWPDYVRQALADAGWPASLDPDARRRADHALAVAMVADVEGLEAMQAMEAPEAHRSEDGPMLWTWDPDADDILQAGPYLRLSLKLGADARSRVWALMQSRLAWARHLADIEEQSDAAARYHRWHEEALAAEESGEDEPAAWLPVAPVLVDEDDEEQWRDRLAECAAHATWNPDEAEREAEDA